MRTAELAALSTQGPVTVHGAPTPVVAQLAADLSADAATVVVVTPTEALARTIARDVGFFRPGGDDLEAPTALFVPSPSTDPYADITPDRSALAGRMAALHWLSPAAPRAPSVVVVSAASLARRVVEPAELSELSWTVRAGASLDRDAMAERLVRAGYARTSVVEDPGTFAVRGGVLDVFPSRYRFPIRIDLFGDEIESLRSFDPSTQRTLRELGELHLHPVRETVTTSGAELRRRILAAADAAEHPSSETRRIVAAAEAGEEFVGIETLTPAFHRRMSALAEHFDPSAPWIVVDTERIVQEVRGQLERAEERYHERLADHRLAFAPDEHYVAADEIAKQLGRERRIEVEPLERPGATGTVVRLRVDDNQLLRRNLERVRREQATELMQPLLRAFSDWKDLRIALAVPSASRRQRLRGLLAEYGHTEAVSEASDLSTLPRGVPTLVPRELSEGFASAADGLAVVTEDEIFGARRRDTARQREAARRAKKALMGGSADFSSLTIGDLLVHDIHGVGRYQGLVKLPTGGHELDFLHVEYRGGILYLPVYRMGEIQRYVGAEGVTPSLDKLGGVSFDKARRKVTLEVRALAEELLKLYAQRAALPGHAFPSADAMFGEFEATFEFEETPDQKRAIDDVLADMERALPMDRLVCGDVGYGKTEVALRAMLKGVLGGKQVAMLAPTTVLVEQHYQTMRKRFAGWPVRIGRMSRFQDKKSQVETVKGLADGSIDAVVGTHRLLSKDIRFKDLGLLIIDEEQRFGVTHKERLKRMRTQIDVLTLTATPIPRTLHLAMSGLRDLSIIATPPADRRSIRTFVAHPEDGVLRDAVKNELARGGQVFFVSPRIEATMGEPSLEEWAERIRELVPEARVATAHGQMKETELESRMVQFIDGELDVLVSTTIVESGLDISRANTMLIASADRFGLAQLYQLRGRIGRSRERAFCYLLVPSDGKLTPEARRRLEVLQRFSDLGAGFAIASQDLEIRGAGELLGAKQSGSIAAVGFETYARLLEEAVSELRGEEIHRASDPELNVADPGFLPDDYVPDVGQRLDLYKRLSAAEDEDEISELLGEIADRYGPLPEEVDRLAELMVLKGLAARLRVASLELGADRMVLAFTDQAPLSPTALLDRVQASPGRLRLTPDMRLSCRLDKGEGGPMEAAKAVLLDLHACVTDT